MQKRKIVRQLALADLEEYFTVLHEGYKSDIEYNISFKAITSTKEEALIQLQTNPTYGLFIEEKLVSAISIRHPWGNNPGPIGLPHIGWFVTHPDYTHEGLGKYLYFWLEKQILRTDLIVPAITLGTAENHPWLKKMYESFGFKEFSKVKKAENTHTTIYFIKILNKDLFKAWLEKNNETAAAYSFDKNQ